MSGAVPLFPLHDFMAWIEETLSFMLIMGRGSGYPQAVCFHINSRVGFMHVFALIFSLPR